MSAPQRSFGTRGASILAALVIVAVLGSIAMVLDAAGPNASRQSQGALAGQAITSPVVTPPAAVPQAHKCEQGHDYAVSVDAKGNKTIVDINVCQPPAGLKAPTQDSTWGTQGANECVGDKPNPNAKTECNVIYCKQGASPTGSDYSACYPLNAPVTNGDTFTGNQVEGGAVAQNALEKGLSGADGVKQSMADFGLSQQNLNKDQQQEIANAFTDQADQQKQLVDAAAKNVETAQQQLDAISGSCGERAGSDPATSCGKAVANLAAAQRAQQEAQQEADRLKGLAAAAVTLQPAGGPVAGPGAGAGAGPGADGSGKKDPNKEATDPNQIKPPSSGGGQKSGGGSGQPQNTFPQQTQQTQCPQQGYVCSGATAGPNGQPQGGQVMYYQMSNNQCTPQLFQSCQYGCSSAGNSCAPQSQQQCQPQLQSPPPDASCTTGGWQGIDINNNIVYNNHQFVSQQYQPYGQQVCIVSWRCMPNSNGNNGGQPTALLTDASNPSNPCPKLADIGGPISFGYACTNATQSQGQNFSTNNAMSGTYTGSIPQLPQGTNAVTYGLACTNAQNQTVSAQCVVQVGKPAIVFVANPDKPKSGTADSLGWITSGMKSCVISDNDYPDFTSQNANNTNPNGSVQSPVLTHSTTFTLNCQTIGGQVKTVSLPVQVI